MSLINRTSRIPIFELGFNSLKIEAALSFCEIASLTDELPNNHSKMIVKPLLREYKLISKKDGFYLAHVVWTQSFIN